MLKLLVLVVLFHSALLQERLVLAGMDVIGLVFLLFAHQAPQVVYVINVLVLVV
jgi:hypothetical protein